MTGEVRERLVDALRESLRDGEVSLGEQDQIETMARELSVDGVVLADLMKQTRPHLLEASRRLSLGIDLVRRGSYEEARHEFLAATLHDPGDFIAWTNLAEAHRLTGRVRSAEEASAKALAQAPSSWLVQYNHGLLLAELERPEVALDHLEKAVLLVDEANRDALLNDLETNPALAELRRQGRVKPLTARGSAR